MIRGTPENNAEALENHLLNTKDLDVTALQNKEGYTPLTYAAYENKIDACMRLVKFVQ